MTLRKATLLLISLGSLVMLLLVVSITHVTMEASFADIERENTQRDMDRARNAINEELQKLDSLVLDWAAWDGARDYMLTRSTQFETTTLHDRSLISLGLSAIVFVDRKGDIAWMQGFNPTRGIKTPVPAQLVEALAPDSKLLEGKTPEDRIKGLVLLPQGIMLLASCPITGSSGTGPCVGTLVMMRPLGEPQAAMISERTRLPLTIERADSPLAPDIIPLAKAGADHGESEPAFGPVSDAIFCGLLMLPDIWGNPALRLELREPRDIMLRGVKALNQAHLLVTTGALLFLAAFMIFLERRVLRRMVRLKHQVEAIGEAVSEDQHSTSNLGRVEMPGNDELSSLARRINGTLEELERSRQGLSIQFAMAREQEDYLQHILDSIQAGVILIDPQTCLIREVNAFAAASVGRTRLDMIGKPCQGFLCPNGEGRCPTAELDHLGGEQLVGDLLRADGERLPVLKSVSRIDRAGMPLLLETFIDVGDLQQAQEALKRSEETYRAVFMNTGTATIIIEADTTISLANQEFVKLSGLSREEMEGKRRWPEFFVPEDAQWMLRHHTKRRQSPDLAPRNYEARFRNRRGETRVVLLTVGMIPMSQLSVASLEDITERKEAEDQLRHQAFHDTLTGLPNRQLLLDRLGRSLESARREGHDVAVLLMDLDRFKDVNDSLGHSAGDRLLKLVAARLDGAVRRSDTVARLGGDEFVLVVDGPAGETAAGMVARHILDCFATPFEMEGQSLHVRLSIGIALFTENGVTPEDMLKNADLAMYRAKERGRDTFAFYTKDLNDQVLLRLAVETNLRRALDADGIEVFYQPKVKHHMPAGPGGANRGCRIVGAEALVRMRREDGLIIGPDDFIGVAENTGLIIPLSDMVLRQACRQTVIWRQGEHKDFVMAVNLSPRQFTQPGLTQRIREIIAETGVPPEALEFEITENLLLDIRPETLEALNALRDMGACVVLDDFGKEYSSLAYIKKLPIQAIKIDRSFVDGLPDDMDDTAIVQTILSMAHNLELRVVAEGVENASQLAHLIGLGCREFQGYYFSKPVPALDMQALLDQVSPFAPAT